jgi:hypothetical protein
MTCLKEYIHHKEYIQALYMQALAISSVNHENLDYEYFLSQTTLWMSVRIVEARTVTLTRLKSLARKQLVYHRRTGKEAAPNKSWFTVINGQGLHFFSKYIKARNHQHRVKTAMFGYILVNVFTNLCVIHVWHPMINNNSTAMARIKVFADKQNMP